MFKARRCNTSQSRLEPSATCVCVWKCGHVPDTDKTENNVRATRCSVFTPRRVHDIRWCLYAKSEKKSANAQESCKVAATKDLQRVCAITLSTTCDLAIESLGVRVDTIVVRMMKRKTSRFFQCLILHWMVFALRSFFGTKEFCRPCSCRRLVGIFVVGLKSFRARIDPAWRSSSLHTSVMVLSYQYLSCHGAV